MPQHVSPSYSNTDLTTGNLTEAKHRRHRPVPLPVRVQRPVADEVWKRNDGWWATKALGLKPAPTYVVDIKNGTNAAALANFQAGNIDLFNNFAPKAAIKGNAKTYFSVAPYHLGATPSGSSRTRRRSR